MAKMVEIASFADREEAELTAYFLQRHGLNAFAGSAYHGEQKSISPHHRMMDCPVLVAVTDADEARRLLKDVMDGKFAHADPEKDSREGLGAALTIALAPTPGYRKPKAWLLWLPILVLIAAWMAGMLIGPLLPGGSLWR